MIKNIPNSEKITDNDVFTAMAEIYYSASVIDLRKITEVIESAKRFLGKEFNPKEFAYHLSENDIDIYDDGIDLSRDDILDIVQDVTLPIKGIIIDIMKSTGIQPQEIINGLNLKAVDAKSYFMIAGSINSKLLDKMKKLKNKPGIVKILENMASNGLIQIGGKYAV